MQVRKIRNITASKLEAHLNNAINHNSRFTCEIEIMGVWLKIRNIRLRENKVYCGNHPNACEFGGRHKRLKYLEGADWVEFNDLVNDVCDELNVSANIRTAACIIRKDTRRRTYYGSTRLGFNYQWNMDEDDDCYDDYCGEDAPDSYFPYGTPGNYLRGNANYQCVG